MKPILAIGGGGFLAEEAAPIDSLVLELTGKTSPRVCFLATPSGDIPRDIDKFYAAFPATRCTPSHVAFFRTPGPDSVPLARCEEHLLSQDAIYVGGGNTKSALAVWRDWGVDRTFARAHDAGIVLAGVSAGAMCWFEAGLTDSYWGAGYQPLTCLGLLSGACGVHYHSNPERQTRLAAAIEAGVIPDAVAIDDAAAVLYDGMALVKAVSWRRGAGAYSVSSVDGRAVESPLAVEWIG